MAQPVCRRPPTRTAPSLRPSVRRPRSLRSAPLQPAQPQAARRSGIPGEAPAQKTPSPNQIQTRRPALLPPPAIGQPPQRGPAPPPFPQSPACSQPGGAFQEEPPTLDADQEGGRVPGSRSDPVRRISGHSASLPGRGGHPSRRHELKMPLPPPTLLEANCLAGGPGSASDPAGVGLHAKGGEGVSQKFLSPLLQELMLRDGEEGAPALEGSTPPAGRATPTDRRSRGGNILCSCSEELRAELPGSASPPVGRSVLLQLRH